jgi:nucleoside-diphosphate-sugar epimerase
VRILILGGTRFLGRRVAETLLAAGHDLTLLSRCSGGAPTGAKHICAERGVGLAKLKDSCFDLVLDFICYDNEGLDQLVANIVFERYVLISSSWLPRLWSGARADELATGPITAAAQLPDVTLNYLSGKLLAEQALTKLRQLGSKAVSLRLPIMLGEGDYTGRLDFYRRRMADGGPLIVVDGGQNYAQIAEMANLAQAIVRWSTELDIGRFSVWEALPNEGRSVREIIETMATAAGVTAALVDVPAAELARDLPTYLEQEPFWRESALPLTAANIYAAVGMVPAVFGQGFSMLANVDDTVASLRLEELRFLANRRAN